MGLVPNLLWHLKQEPSHNKKTMGFRVVLTPSQILPSQD
jgi:hypothetical protein